MQKWIKAIRISAFIILLLMFINETGNVIVKCADTVNAVKIRNIFYHILPIVFIAFILLIVILIKNPQLKLLRVTILDVLSIVMFIVLMLFLRKEVMMRNDIRNAFHGNNEYFGFYTNGIGGDKGYADMEKMLEDEIERTEKTGKHSKVEEIYRIQTGEKIFIYYKIDEEYMMEVTVLQRDDFYYNLGSTYILYNGVKNGTNYTTEETIRNDIANTMWREDWKKNLNAPAWGVSADEQIFSMTINSENIDKIILINETNEKKIYFWIITNLEGIKTFEDIKSAEIGV